MLYMYGDLYQDFLQRMELQLNELLRLKIGRESINTKFLAWVQTAVLGTGPTLWY